MNILMWIVISLTLAAFAGFPVYVFIKIMKDMMASTLGDEDRRRAAWTKTLRKKAGGRP